MLAKTLPLDSVGTYTLAQTISQLLVPIYTANTTVALTRESLSHPSAARKLFSIIISVVAIGSFITVIVAITFRFPHWIFLSVLSGSFEALSSAGLAILQGRESARAIVAISGLKTTLFIVVVAVTISLNWSIELLLLGQVATGLISFCIIAICVYRELIGAEHKDDTPSLRTMFAYSVSTFPHTLALWLSVSADRFAIGTLLGKSQLGLYSIAYTVAQTVALAMSGMSAAVPPRVASNPILWRSVQHLKKVIGYVALAAYSVIVLLCFAVRIDHEWFHFLKNMPQNGPLLIALLGTGFHLSFYYVLFASYMYLNRDTRAIAVSGLFVGPINVLFMLILIYYFGVVGAACGVVFSYAMFAIAYGSAAVRLEANLRDVIPYILLIISFGMAISVTAGSLLSWNV